MDPPSPLSEELLTDVANLRARGRSWEAVAEAISWDAAGLCRAVRHDPHYPAALEAARREVLAEAEADAVFTLRTHMRSQDETSARRAAEIMGKYLSACRRDDTRLEVERLRAEAQLAKANAKYAKKDEGQAEVQEEDFDTPEERARGEAIRARSDRWNAEQAAREKSVVYLWGGCHKLGDTPPDATDTPLHIIDDSTVRGRTIYWAITDLPPVPDLERGPFLAPPGCRPNTCPGEPTRGGDSSQTGCDRTEDYEEKIGEFFSTH